MANQIKYKRQIKEALELIEKAKLSRTNWINRFIKKRKQQKQK